jgi:hypothetical protein
MLILIMVPFTFKLLSIKHETNNKKKKKKKVCCLFFFFLSIYAKKI